MVKLTCGSESALSLCNDFDSGLGVPVLLPMELSELLTLFPGVGVFCTLRPRSAALKPFATGICEPGPSEEVMLRVAGGKALP